jgi:hypothetical protein
MSCAAAVTARVYVAFMMSGHNEASASQDCVALDGATFAELSYAVCAAHAAAHVAATAVTMRISSSD